MNGLQSTELKNKATVILVGTGTMGSIRAKDLYANPRFNLVAICDVNLSRAAELADIYSCDCFATLEEALVFFQSPQTAIEIHQEHATPFRNDVRPAIVSCDNGYNVKHSKRGTSIGTTASTSNMSMDSLNSSSNICIDGVVLSIPTTLHAKYINIAAQNDLAIFVEKPVDQSSDEVQSLVDLCKSHNIPLCCGFQRRFDASYLAAAEKVRSGEIGQPLSATIFFGDHPCPTIEFLRAGGDIFSDLAIHDVNYIQYALEDKVDSVYAEASNSSRELKDIGVHDTAIILLHFKKGALVNIILNRRSCYGYDQRCEIFGEKGMVVVGNEFCNSTVHFSADGSAFSKLKDSYPDRYCMAYQAEMNAFADTIIVGKQWPGKNHVLPVIITVSSMNVAQICLFLVYVTIISPSIM